jgi:hypothetical protein
MRSIIATLLLALSAFSCGGPRYVDYFPYHDDGTVKPKIALVPIKDSTLAELPWNLSAELSNALYEELMNSGELYVLSPTEVGAVWSQCPSLDFFGIDLSFCQQFYNADFIVAMELLEHSVTPDQFHSVSSARGTPCNQLLTLKMRVRVLDLRFGKPRDILYEMVDSDYLISAPFDQIDYTKCGWGWERFHKTPFGTAHQRLVCKLTARLEESIWSAK